MPGRHRRPSQHRTTARAAGVVGIAAVGLPLAPGSAVADDVVPRDADSAPQESVAQPGPATPDPVEAPDPTDGHGGTPLPDVRDTAGSAAPDTPAPEVAAPQTSTPDVSAPDTSTPDVSAPDTSTPDVSTPDTSAPDTSAPDTSAPDVSAPDLPAPGAPQAQVPDRVEDRVPDDVFDGDGAEQSRGAAAVEEASRHQGKPYQWGGSGPVAFDCSGFTKYVYAELGVGLPHSSAAQYEAVQHVPRDDMQVGDLVFIYDENGIYHVGVYAGGDEMWAATKTGDVVRTQEIWTDQFVVGRP